MGVSLMNEIINILNKSYTGYEFREENMEGDIWRIYFEGSNKQFTIEVNLEYTEFYQLPKHKIIDSSEEDYVIKVIDYFEYLLKCNDETRGNSDHLRNGRHDDTIDYPLPSGPNNF